MSNEADLYVLKGIISELPNEDQELIKEICSEFTSVISGHLEGLKGEERDETKKTAIIAASLFVGEIATKGTIPGVE